jgi:hypothetical protein
VKERKNNKIDMKNVKTYLSIIFVVFLLLFIFLVIICLIEKRIPDYAKIQVLERLFKPQLERLSFLASDAKNKLQNYESWSSPKQFKNDQRLFDIPVILYCRFGSVGSEGSISFKLFDGYRRISYILPRKCYIGHPVVNLGTATLEDGTKKDVAKYSAYIPDQGNGAGYFEILFDVDKLKKIYNKFRDPIDSGTIN